MPVSHSASLGTPMLVHLVLVPAAALLAGLLGGYVMSFMLVGRMFDTSAWLGLPWATIVPATFSMALRLLAGLPLALLWLSPMILLVVLLTAWFRKWGWVILTVGLGLGSWLMKWLFGHPFFNDVTRDLLIHAARALVNNTGGKLISNNSQAADTLALVPSWALSDFGHALTELATPLFPAALLVAAACFYLLVQWRQRGASATA
jgi:ABC-2 type transport system permease protein